MTELDDLYQDLILHHSKSPRNFGSLDAPCQHADGYNPLCGDHFEVFVRVNDSQIEKIAFKGTGCALSTASASLMTDAVLGKSVEEAETLFQAMHGMVTGKAVPESLDIGKLEAFEGVQRFPNRVKCATLAWHTMRAALQGDGETVSTE